MDKRPLGIFDSGVGGLTVVREILHYLPDENLIYLGDTARVPYGNRSKDTIIRFALQDTKYLLNKNVKAIIIACNTVSAVAAEEVRRYSNVPVFDVVNYGINEGLNLTKNKVVAVIGTNATINSHAYLNGIKKKDETIQVIEKSCPLFVPFIEEGEIDGDGIEWIAKKYLKDISGSDADTLILACTHYPLITTVLQSILVKITIADPANRLALSLKNYLDQHRLSNNKQQYQNFSFTDLNDRTLQIAEKFLGKPISDITSKIPPFS